MGHADNNALYELNDIQFNTVRSQLRKLLQTLGSRGQAVLAEYFRLKGRQRTRHSSSSHPNTADPDSNPPHHGPPLPSFTQPERAPLPQLTPALVRGQLRHTQ